jgi:anti-anti-sigma factor
MKGVRMDFGASQGELDGFPILRVSGEMDWQSHRALEAGLRELVNAGSRVVLDLRDVTYIESRAIGLLVTTHEDLADHGSAMAIVAAGNVRHILDLVRLGEFFAIFEDPADAVTFLNGLGDGLQQDSADQSAP